MLVRIGVTTGKKNPVLLKDGASKLHF
jgi:hypothetical protein